MLKVIEVFNSIQGEGIQMGLPMTFVRLAGCNMRCSWCDTKYSWEEGEDWTEEEIVARCNLDWCCCTGGEPLLQNLNELVRQLVKKGVRIAVETNGTFEPSEDLIHYVDLWTVSPKSLTVTKAMWKLVGLEMQWKFVVERVDEIAKCVDFVRHNFPGHNDAPIVFQPQRYAHEGDYFRFMDAMVKEAMKFENVRVLPQLQWLMWGGQKGK